MGNWGEKTCISHVIKYPIKWESNGKEAPILYEKYEDQFPRFSQYDGFCCIFLYYEKLLGKPMHFPYDKVYHRMEIQWEKSTHTMGNVWVFPRLFPTMGFFVAFPALWEINGKIHAFPIWWHWLIFSCKKCPRKMSACWHMDFQLKNSMMKLIFESKPSTKL